jgi:anti-sigma28 factor (negative regulator of flagellin synthesis)
MRIDDNFSPSSASSSNAVRSHSISQAPDVRSPGRPQGAGLDGATDRASLSALGVHISRALEQDPPEIVAKIGQLQQAVANGTYSVPSSAVSVKIVASALGSF